MPRAIRVLKQAGDRPVADTLILDYAQRTAPHLSATGIKGGVYDIALHEPTRLRTDDVLELDDGRLLAVVAAPEPVIEARAADLAGLARLAWQLGDRHMPVQVLTNRIRVRRDEAAEALLTSLGAKLTMIEAPFDPEGGAYESSQAQGHDHHHGHAHSQDHHGH